MPARGLFPVLPAPASPAEPSVSLDIEAGLGENATAPVTGHLRLCARAGWDAVWRTRQHPTPSRFQPGTILRSGLGRYGQQAAAGSRSRHGWSQTRHSQ